MVKAPARVIPRKGNKDYSLILIIISLLIFGVVMVYDVSVVLANSSFGGKFYFLILQSLWVLIGFTFMLAFSKIDYHLLSKHAYLIFGIALLLMIIVLIPTPFAPLIYGARRWIYLNPAPFPSFPIIGRQSIQPSEVFKLAVIIYLSTVLTKKEIKPVAFGALLAVFFGLIMMQPDFGTGLLVISIAIGIYFASGVNLAYFIFGVPALALGGLGLILSSAYRRARLITYLTKGFSDPQGASFHINQIMIACIN
jgi:cell division protein FtsW